MTTTQTVAKLKTSYEITRSFEIAAIALVVRDCLRKVLQQRFEINNEAAVCRSRIQKLITRFRLFALTVFYFFGFLVYSA